MVISNEDRHKRRKTGAKRHQCRKKRKNRSGRQPSNTKIGEALLKNIRCRGGNIKKRALRVNEGTFVLPSTGNEYNATIQQVVYHPTSNDLMRTNTLTKSAVLKVGAEPFQNDLKKLELNLLDPILNEAVNKGYVYAFVTSRPGQCGEIRGYVLQGRELEFYVEKFKKKKRLMV